MASQDQNSPPDQGQAEDDATGEGVEEVSTINPRDASHAHWEVIQGFRTDTYGYILEGHPYWSVVSDQELIDYGGMQASAIQDTITSVDLDLMPAQSVGILKARSNNVDETFETYYTLRPQLITFPTIVWATGENAGFYDMSSDGSNAESDMWFSTHDITYSQEEIDGLQARLGDSNSGTSGAAAIEEMLKGRFQQFLLDLSTSTVQNQAIYTKISYNDMRVTNANEIKGPRQSEEDFQESTTPATTGTGTY